MEEDIKILEEWIEETNKAWGKNEWLEEIPMPREKIALENLIKSHREIEEKHNNLFNRYNDRVEEIVKLENERDGIYADYQDLGKEYHELEEELKLYKSQLNSAFDRGFIHKSVIKEKIEELKQAGKVKNITLGSYRTIYLSR